MSRSKGRYRWWKEFAFTTVFLLLTVWMIQFASDVLRPPQKVYGSTWSAFRAEPEDSLDVIYLGSSYAYCDINPSMVYASSGLTSYVMAGSEQTLSITYWYLKEILETQSPAAVMLEVTSLFFKANQNYTQQNIVYMPFSCNKLGAIVTAAEPELRLGLLFDLYFYHSRWNEIGFGDIWRALNPIQWDARKGHTAMEGTKEGAGEVLSEVDRVVTAEDYRANLAWLKKITDLCQEHNIQCFLTIYPSYTRSRPETYARIGRELQAIAPEAIYCDWSDAFDTIGLIPTEHLYDGGHLNQEGTAIFSNWLGGFLIGQGVTPRSQTAENTAAWQAAVQEWEETEAVSNP
ncbi:MAG: hypothetical protein HFE97_01760 [Oscillospiraceae bacterium]|nr:hypothetical protein [Oscillospiraceae bacterium]